MKQKHYKNRSNLKRNLVLFTSLLIFGGSALIISEKLKFTDIIKIYKSPSTTQPTETTNIQQPRPTPTIDETPATKEDNQDINNSKESFPSPTPSTNSPITEFKGKVTLTRLNKTVDSLEVRGFVTDTTMGTCQAQLKNNTSSTVYTESREVRNTGSGYDCNTINIPLSRLSKGDYTVMIKLMYGESSSQSNSLTISI